MALIQLGTIVSNIKGSIGGTTFSSTRAGTVAKRRLTGKRLLSSSASNALSTSKLITTSWNGLTASEQNEFNSYALVNAFIDRYGLTKQLTGFQWFKQLCYANYYWNSTFISVPPAYATPDALPSFDVTLTSDVITFDWSIPIDPAEVLLFMFTTPPIRSNAALPRGAYRLTDIRALDYSSSFNLTEVWNQAHGLNYASLTGSGKFNINIFVVPINKSSFVSGLGVSSSGSFTSITSGIGSMAIGSTFFVD